MLMISTSMIEKEMTPIYMGLGLWPLIALITKTRYRATENVTMNRNRMKMNTLKSFWMFWLILSHELHSLLVDSENVSLYLQSSHYITFAFWSYWRWIHSRMHAVCTNRILPVHLQGTMSGLASEPSSRQMRHSMPSVGISASVNRISILVS